MSRYRSSDRKVYVGDLGKNIGSAASRQELEDSFSYYGPIRDVWVARNPPGFAFVEYEDARDAEDAVRGLDGRTVCGRRVRVEMSNGKGGRGGGHQRGRAFHPDDRCYECGECGHYARDCNRRGRGARRRSYSRGRRSASRSRSRDRGRSRSRNRSRSKDRSKSRDRGRSRSRSVDNRSKSRSRSKSRARDSAGKNGTSRDNANHRPSVSPKTGP